MDEWAWRKRSDKDVVPKNSSFCKLLQRFLAAVQSEQGHDFQRSPGFQAVSTECWGFYRSSLR
jgi:hypothetical protein